MTDPMFAKRYWEIQKVLDQALGDGDDDGTGMGIVEDVSLIVQQRDRALAALAAHDPAAAGDIRGMRDLEWPR